MHLTTLPFKIGAQEKVLADLRHRLRQTRFTAGLRDETRNFGTSPRYLRELVTYWLDSFFRYHKGGIPPRSFAERTLNLRRWTEMPRGSHFAALEEPELFSRDVVEFFDSLSFVSAAGLVK